MDGDPMANPSAPKGEKKLTGKHVLIWVLSFFGVMLVANGFFVYYANTSWPGVEVKSSYNVSQNYNQIIKEAKQQDARAWTLNTDLKRSKNDVFLVVQAKDKIGNALLDLDLKSEIGRTITETFDRTVELKPYGEGVYKVNLGSLDPGRWRVKLLAYQRDELKFQSVQQVNLQ